MKMLSMLFIISVFQYGCTKTSSSVQVTGAVPGTEIPKDPGSSTPSLPSTPVVAVPNSPVTPTADVLIASIPKPVSDPQIAEVKIESIQSAVNADPQYSFTDDDFSALQAEGISIENMEGWVK